PRQLTGNEYHADQARASLTGVSERGPSRSDRIWLVWRALGAEPKGRGIGNLWRLTRSQHRRQRAALTARHLLGRGRGRRTESGPARAGRSTLLGRWGPDHALIGPIQSEAST